MHCMRYDATPMQVSVIWKISQMKGTRYHHLDPHTNVVRTQSRSGHLAAAFQSPLLRA